MLAIKYYKEFVHDNRFCEGLTNDVRFIYEVAGNVNSAVF